MPSAAPSKTPPSIPYGVIRQRHPDCDDKLYEQLEDLYEGGWVIQAKAKKYLDKLQFEHAKRHEARCKTASYQPYFGQIVDQFVADLFTQPLSIHPPGDADNPNTPGDYPDKDYYTALAKDLDGDGNELAAVAADVLTTALKHRRAYIMVDAPDVDDDFANKAEEDAAGASRLYAYEVKPKHVIDWKADKHGSFEWAMLWYKEQERNSPTGKRDEITETFTLWTLDENASKARWARYKITYTPDKQPRDETLVVLDDEKVSSFDRIPLLCLKLPKGLWVGNKIGTQALEHWRRRSQLIGAQAVSCVAIPVAKLAGEMPAVGESLPSEVAQNPNRGRDPVAQFEKTGFVALGDKDSLDFAEPNGHAYEIIDKQLDGLREAMYAVNHQMAASVRGTNTALGRSGLSKQKDHESTAKVLGALGRYVRRLFVRLYDTIGKARNEPVEWVAHGLDSYEADDREQVLEESIQIQQVAITSSTFRKEHMKRVAAKLVPNLPPATMAQIADEIDEGVEQVQEVKDLEQDAKKEQLKNPQAAVPSGMPGQPAMAKPGLSKPPAPTPAK